MLSVDPTLYQGCAGMGRRWAASWEPSLLISPPDLHCLALGSTINEEGRLDESSRDAPRTTRNAESLRMSLQPPLQLLSQGWASHRALGSSEGSSQEGESEKTVDLPL